jgi:hypothetical protein
MEGGRNAVGGGGGSSFSVDLEWNWMVLGVDHYPQHRNKCGMLFLNLLACHTEGAWVRNKVCTES